MQQIYRHIFETFPPKSPVWIFGADRLLNDDELFLIRQKLTQFIDGWNAHGTKLMADFEIVEHTFIVVVANESYFKASGCSIDSLVRFVKQLGKTISVDFFNRLSLLIKQDEQSKRIHFSELDTYLDWDVFDTSVSDIDLFREKFRVKVSESPLLST